MAQVLLWELLEWQSLQTKLHFKKIGMNQYSPTPMSGAPIIGRAGEPNFGRIQSGALEASNTDATAEMAKMIKAQQAFSGSSRMLQAEADITKRLMG